MRSVADSRHVDQLPQERFLARALEASGKNRLLPQEHRVSGIFEVKAVPALPNNTIVHPSTMEQIDISVGWI